MWLKWLPWRFALSRLARSKGFIDPVAFMSRLQGFAQPSEVAVPLELIRAGAVFHARGFINTRAIQHNLDWIWPYWVEQQFDPHSRSFIPRAFSITHVNLSHRNWTAVGRPGFGGMPIVDPRGLVTPHFDGWSLDLWVADESLAVPGLLLPARAGDEQVQQRLELPGGLSVQTQVSAGGASLLSRTWVSEGGNGDGRGGTEAAPYTCRIDVVGSHDAGGYLVVSLRPANPEGVSFVHDVAWQPEQRRWLVNGSEMVKFAEAPERSGASCYRDGDIVARLGDCGESSQPARQVCDVGLATAAVLFRLEPGKPRELSLQVPLKEEDRAQERLARREPAKRPLVMSWEAALAPTCRIEVPDARWQFLYDAAVRTLVLLAPDDVYPGPYTYKRFWFRDAALMLHALLAVGLDDLSEHVMRRFPRRQRPNGYFHSQDGEWDSNGEVLWVLGRFVELTGRPLGEELLTAARAGARWIQRKRLPARVDDEASRPRAGLLPAGFSAEHLGPNDYYYWDDFWGVAGLRAAAELMRRAGDARTFDEFTQASQDFMACIERSIQASAPRRARPGVPASPYRRMDAGAIGSIVVGYPLQLWEPRDPRLLDTVEFLLAHCTVRGGFFQDMIHSGINAYLTLHLAQVLLRAGDRRYADLVAVVAELASPTGQWPEAIHPQTLGGCMGDGQHGWAAAEWVLMMRSLFVREEAGRLVLGSGVPRAWLKAGRALRCGPAPTPYGPLSIEIEPAGAAAARVRWSGQWRAAAPRIEVALPGAGVVVADGTTECVVSLESIEPDTGGAEGR